MTAVVDSADGADKKKPFKLSFCLDAFSSLTVELTVPLKKSHWKRSLNTEWQKLRAQFADKTPGTQKLYISKFRSAVKNAIEAAEVDVERGKGIVAEVKNEVLIFEASLALAVEEEGKARIRNYSTGVTAFPAWESALGELRMLLHHSDPELIAIGLMAVTGRRMSEVLSAGSFGPVQQRIEAGKVTQRYSVGFHGQMKTRGADGSKYDQWYNIPVLADGVDVLNAVERLKSSPKGAAWEAQESSRLNDTANTPLNRALHGRSDLIAKWPKSEIDTDERGKRLSLKFLRAFYAEVAFHYFASESDTKHGYFHSILGHSDDDYTSSMSYMRYSLSSQILPADKREMKRLRELLEESEARRSEDKDDSV